MTVKHTPAPWRVSRADRDGAGVHAVACIAWCGVSSNYGQTPETTQHIDADECAANARLIAAAPELLAACEAVAATTWSRNTATLIGEQVRAAIEKARGP